MQVSRSPIRIETESVQSLMLNMAHNQARPTLKWIKLQDTGDQHDLVIDNRHALSIRGPSEIHNTSTVEFPQYDEWNFGERKWSTISCFHLVMNIFFQMGMIVEKAVPTLESIAANFIVSFCQMYDLPVRTILNDRKEIAFFIHRDVLHFDAWHPILYTECPPLPEFDIKHYGYKHASIKDNSVLLLPHDEYPNQQFNMQFYKVLYPKGDSHPIVINFALTDECVLKVEFVDYYHLRFRTALKIIIENVDDFENIFENWHPDLLDYSIKNTTSLDINQLEAICHEGHNTMNMLYHGYLLHKWILQDDYERTFTNILASSVRHIPADLSPYHLYRMPTQDHIQHQQYLGLHMDLHDSASETGSEVGWYAHGFVWEELKDSSSSESVMSSYSDE